MLEGGEAFDALRAEHGFAALVTFTRGDRQHRILFDTGISPDGLVENMRRLELSPGDVEAIVLSHGHFDHVGGMQGLVRELGTANLPVFLVRTLKGDCGWGMGIGDWGSGIGYWGSGIGYWGSGIGGRRSSIACSPSPCLLVSLSPCPLTPDP